MEKAFVLPEKWEKIFYGFVGVGILSFILAFLFSPERAYHGILALAFYFTLIAHFGLFYIAIHLVGGNSSLAITRRLAERTYFLYFVALFFAILVFLFSHQLYEWTHTEVVEKDPILKGKSGYLNLPFFILRTLFFFALWIGIGYFLLRFSREQDQFSEKASLIRSKMVKLSALFIVVYVYTFAFYSIDFLMSLEPHWYSNMFPVYGFTVMMNLGFSGLILLLYLIQKEGGLEGLNKDHYHDLGKWLFSWVCFWAYIAFSQFMLIWYGNLPEETIYIENRLRDANWKTLTAILWVGHFFIPFFILLFREVKRRAATLAKVALWVHFISFVDIIWMVYGGKKEITGFPFSFYELGFFLFGVGVSSLVIFKAYARVPQVAYNDPLLEESLNFHSPH